MPRAKRPMIKKYVRSTEFQQICKWQVLAAQRGALANREVSRSNGFPYSERHNLLVGGGN
jgi:hypothetical protein